MLGLMGFSGSLPLYVIHRYYIFVFIDRANKDACLLVCSSALYRGPQSSSHSFIALPMTRCSKSAQRSPVQMSQVATVVMETTQLVLSQFKNF